MAGPSHWQHAIFRRLIAHYCPQATQSHPISYPPKFLIIQSKRSGLSAPIVPDDAVFFQCRGLNLQGGLKHPFCVIMSKSKLRNDQLVNAPACSRSPPGWLEQKIRLNSQLVWNQVGMQIGDRSRTEHVMRWNQKEQSNLLLLNMITE